MLILKLSYNLEFQDAPFNDEIVFKTKNSVGVQKIRKCGDATCNEVCCEEKNCCKKSETNIKQNDY